MSNRAIIQALLVVGLGIAAAGCELYRDVRNYNRNLLGGGEPEKETAEPKTEAVISRGYNKPQTRAEGLDQYCANRANRTGRFITAYVEVRGQRLTCKEYVTLRAEGWSATETETVTDRPSKTFTVEEIIRLKNAGVSDEVILQHLQSGRGNLPR